MTENEITQKYSDILQELNDHGINVMPNLLIHSERMDENEFDKLMLQQKYLLELKKNGMIMPRTMFGKVMV